MKLNVTSTPSIPVQLENMQSTMRLVTEGVIHLKSLFIQKQVAARPHKFWEMNTPEMTPEVKRELEIISMRSYWDSASFFKVRFVLFTELQGKNRKELPKEFEVVEQESDDIQIGTVVAGTFDGKRGTLTRREKKQSLADELVADEAFKSRSDVVVEKEKARRFRPKHKKRHQLNMFNRKTKAPPTFEHIDLDAKSRNCQHE